jgi:acyl-CoA dehydrogenase
MKAQFPDYALDADGSPSRYRRYEEGRGLNYYEADSNLRAVLAAHLDEATLRWAEERLHVLGERCGTEIVRRADTYDRVGHQLVRYDRFGRDVSRIAYHPDWLLSLNGIFDFGLVGWNYDASLLARYGRAPVTLLTALDYLVGQADMALCCPVELAHGAVVVLERFADEALRRRLLPAVVSTSTATRFQVAQVLTEITGGSDVGSTRTEARREDGRWLLHGEKWFASNVGADLIVTLARVDTSRAGTQGLAMFIVPRRRDDGSQNRVSIRRLKDKMGTIGVPTGELIFDDAEAYLVGEPDAGFHSMAEMLNHTRYWNAAGSVGLMRRAFLEAAIYTARRRAFGDTLDTFPMMRERLVWLQVDLLATTALLFHTGAALDQFERSGDPHHHLRFRTLAPVMKYRSGEQNVDFARAAIEMLGGNGYVADFGTPRLLRDAQVNPVWEGTSNMCALDLWRAISKQRGHEAVLAYAEQLLDRLDSDAARRLAATARQSIANVRTGIGYLSLASLTRQTQQARRLADLFGDALALAALAHEADIEARAGDYRKALVAELFALRMNSAETRRTIVTDAFDGIPDLYPTFFADGAVSEAAYAAALEGLPVSRAQLPVTAGR